MINEGIVNFTKQKGMGIIAWTVNNRDAIKYCFNKGIQGVITDYKEATI